MPKEGDSFIVILKQSHVDWGNHRYTSSRGAIDGEGYIPIPLPHARNFGIYNSNYEHNGLGYNLFHCKSVDGYFSGILKAAGSRGSGDIYAKQFEGNGDLKALGRWFKQCSAKVGDKVQVCWTSPTELTIEIV